MKTKTITLYDYSELSEKAQEKAYQEWYKDEYDPLMQSHMINLLTEELDERGIKHGDMDVRYSLSYSQGDGFMFIGKVEWRGVDITITHKDFHYCHYRTADFDYNDEELTDAEFGQFEVVYEDICKKMERKGYDHIEWVTSKEMFEQQCDGNEWTFREDGTMENL